MTLSFYRLAPPLFGSTQILGTIISSIINSILAIKYTQQHILSSLAYALEIDFDQFLKIEKPYMTTSEIMKMKSGGFHIGAHSISHPYYGDISSDEQLRQTKESLIFVEKVFETNISSFAFPFSSDMLHAKIIFSRSAFRQCNL